MGLMKENWLSSEVIFFEENDILKKNLYLFKMTVVFLRDLATLPFIRWSLFTCLFSVYNVITLSRHEFLYLMRVISERNFSHHWAT